jgi:hypothetical protein
MIRAGTFVATSTLTILLAMVGTTAMAEDRDLGKHDAGEIQSTCQREKGSFASNGQTYGCSKKCTGGTCAVICDKDNGCIGTTPANRLQGATGDRGILDALNATKIAAPAHDDKSRPWGLLGLLDLVGLLALNRRH